MQDQLFNIGIYEEAILLTDFRGAAEKRFVIEEEELMKLFRFDRHVVFRPFEGLIWMKGSLDGGDQYCVIKPREKRKLIHDQKGKLSHITMEMPRMIVKARSSGGNLHVNHMYAYQGKLTRNSKLYSLALPNIGSSHLCQGSQRVSESIGIMNAIDQCIYETPFNHHQHRVSKEEIPFLEYVKKYKGRMPFHTLKEIGTGQDILEEK
jgi:hypothetical protein